MAELNAFLYDPPGWFYFIMICVGITILQIGSRGKDGD